MKSGWPTSWGRIIGVSVVGAFILYAYLSASGTGSSATDSAASVETAEAPEVTEAPQWRYSHDKDDMSNGVNHDAAIESINVVEFDFPYAGPQHATLVLRTHPRYGKNILLVIERGQFLFSAD